MRIRSWKCHPDFPISDHASFRGLWEFELKSGEKSIPHLHEDGDEIAVALEGKGQITVGDVSREIAAGEVIFIPAQTSHYLENVSSPLLRGITLETGLAMADYAPAPPPGGTTVKDLDQVITGIPDQLDESEALQIIIQLFDLAGHLSEQIENALGLECPTGYGALTDIQRRVMGAVVQISQSYSGGLTEFPPRF